MSGWIHWDLVSVLPACMNEKTIFQKCNYYSILTNQNQASENTLKLRCLWIIINIVDELQLSNKTFIKRMLF